MVPITGRMIPIFIHSKHEFSKHRNSHLGIPAINEADAEFVRTMKEQCEALLDDDKHMQPDLDTLDIRTGENSEKIFRIFL